MRSILSGLACSDVKTVSASPRLRAAKAIPWPKLPAVVQTRWGRPSSAAARYSAPRPLNERIGFRVSTLTTNRQPSRGSRVSARNCGESRNTGSIRVAACAIRSSESRWSVTAAILWGAPDGFRQTILDLRFRHPGDLHDLARRGVAGDDARLGQCDAERRRYDLLHRRVRLATLRRRAHAHLQGIAQPPSEAIARRPGHHLDPQLHDPATVDSRSQ